MRAMLLLSCLSLALLHCGATDPVIKFGIITDVHYADADPVGTRIYRDSLPKARAAVKTISAANSSFLIELGDFKDTDAGRHCDTNPTPQCVNLTEGFLDTIEKVVSSGFDGPHFHVLGNHDVDILDQPAVFNHEHNPVIELGGNQSEGYYSWGWPVGSDTQPLRFIALNGDYTGRDLAWRDLDVASAVPGMAWDHPNVPSWQLTWLYNELDAALDAKQRVIVFVHYRLDGGIGGPVGTGVGPAIPAGHRDWVDDCTLDNAGVVRAILERHPGLVLATFSGHDHAPVPGWTRESNNSVVYWTHAGMIEGHWPSSNAFSIVSVGQDCSIQVEGFGNATSAQLPGPAGCTLRT